MNSPYEVSSSVDFSECLPLNVYYLSDVAAFCLISHCDLGSSNLDMFRKPLGRRHPSLPTYASVAQWYPWALRCQGDSRPILRLSVL